MSKKANMKTVVEAMALGGQERRVVKLCVRSSAAMSACHSRAGCVFYSLGDASPQCNLSAHLAISQVQNPFILKSKQLTLLYSFMPQVFVERILWAPAAGHHTVAVDGAEHMAPGWLLASLSGALVCTEKGHCGLIHLLLSIFPFLT